MVVRKRVVNVKSQRNQALKRPGQYIGSPKNEVEKVWVAEKEETEEGVDYRIYEKEINNNFGLIHIFSEPLDNAKDNYFESEDTDYPLKKIEVTVDQETGEISIWNDGLWIPIKHHQWTAEEKADIKINEDMYEADIIFGLMNSSTNYNDEEKGNERRGGGLHGVGVKLTNIFSSNFRVETVDPALGLKYVGEWSNNMGTKKPPKVTKCRQKKGYTKVTYTADFARFGVEGYSDDHLAVMRRKCIECAMNTGKLVVFNGERFNIKTFAKYVNYYGADQQIEIKGEDSTVILCEKEVYEGEMTQFSWVNGIHTVDGGKHVDAWKHDLLEGIRDKLKKVLAKGKGKASIPVKLTLKQLEKYFMIFVKANVLNPEFHQQIKTKLTSPTPKVYIPPGKFDALMKWNFVEDVKDIFHEQQLKTLNKHSSAKSRNIKNIPNAEDAGKAGTVKSHLCSILITEGLSAKTIAMKGRSTVKDGNDWYGVLPIKGKLINVRGMPLEKALTNTEVKSIIQMIGLRFGMDYRKEENRKTLRYGKLIIFTDADADGDHIKGLIINFIECFFPTLIEIGFVTSIRTPIVKASLGNAKTQKTFYYEKDFRDWSAKQTKPVHAKYYKGLGTNSDGEIRQIFENPRVIAFNDDDGQCKKTAELVFGKKNSDDRKKWLEDFEEKDFTYETENGEENVPASEFFNNEMILFSINDNKRSIPSVVDGLKPGQRKALFVARKVLKTTGNGYKVAQFAGEVSKKAAYHHGEKSMEDTVIGMAQTFLGSNNIALLKELGQFGTRLEGGADASSARYIFTCLSKVTNYIFRKEDDPILDYLTDDGKSVEPRYFVPIIPMVLVNKNKGIGTGWSSEIPAFNPVELVEWIKLWLEHEADTGEEYNDYPELVPWYWGFKGRTEYDPDNKKRVNHYGNIVDHGDHYEITELPVGVWTNKYKEHLEEMMSGFATENKKKSAPKGYDAMNVAQLKKILRERKIPVGGTKKVLVKRLKDDDKRKGTTPTVKATVDKYIKSYRDTGNPYHAKFEVVMLPGKKLDYSSKFKLVATETTSNMTAFTPSGGLKKYPTVEAILREFCNVRYDTYKKRKRYLINILKENLAEETSKARFVQLAIKSIATIRQPKDKLYTYLEKNGYWKKVKKIIVEEDEEADTELPQEEDNFREYDYLFRIPMGMLNNENYKKLASKIESIKAEIEYVKKKSPKEMYIGELNEFLPVYKKWQDEIIKMREELLATPAKKKVVRRKR